jgi:hypothetical protein
MGRGEPPSKIQNERRRDGFHQEKTNFQVSKKLKQECEKQTQNKKEEYD